MFCRKCGKELDGNAKFCCFCGQKIIESEGKSEIEKTENKKVEEKNYQDNKSLKKFLGLFFMIAIVLGVVLILGNLKKSINLEDYVIAEFYGYDTVGTGYFYIDNIEIPEVLLNSIYLTPSYSENLSNGDELVISIYYDNDIAKEFDIKFSGEQVKLTVNGLTELIEINPFDGFSFDPYGTSPFGMAEFSYSGNNEYIKAEDFYYYNIEDEMNLRNGKAVTIEYMNPLNAAEYGYEITEQFKEFKVEGLDEYVESFDDLPESFLTYAKEEAVDSINAYAAKEYSENVGMTSPEYVGYIFKVRKDSALGEYNVMHLIYKSKLSHTYGFFDEQYIYYPVTFYRIVKSDEIVAEMQGVEGYTEDPIKTVGYRLPSLVYEELVTGSEESYNVVVGDGFEMYEASDFVYSIADIGEGTLQLLEDRAVSLITEYVEDNEDFWWYTIGETKAIGEYLLVAKNQSDLKQANNKIIVVCSVSLVDEKGNAFLLYMPVLYEDVEMLPDGEFTYAIKEITGYYRGVDGYGASLSKGYLDESEMYNDLVKVDLNNYNEEICGGLQAY